MSRLGGIWHGRPGTDGLVTVRPAMPAPGLAVMSWNGVAGLGSAVWVRSGGTRRDTSCLGPAVKVRRGWERPRVSCRGSAVMARASRKGVLRAAWPSWTEGSGCPGMDCLGRPGSARVGVAWLGARCLTRPSWKVVEGVLPCDPSRRGCPALSRCRWAMLVESR